MSSADHWASAMIGTPWIAGESDCWSFARRVWRERFGWDVPPLAVDASSARAGRRALATPPEAAGWVRVERPAEGDAVLMARGTRPCHVGIWIEPDGATPNGSGVLHSVEGPGVIFTPLSGLSALGWHVTGFWRRA